MFNNLLLENASILCRSDTDFSSTINSMMIIETLNYAYNKTVVHSITESLHSIHDSFCFPYEMITTGRRQRKHSFSGILTLASSSPTQGIRFSSIIHFNILAY